MLVMTEEKEFHCVFVSPFSLSTSKPSMYNDNTKRFQILIRGLAIKFNDLCEIIIPGI